MQNNSIYVGLSSLITLERRMDAIAHNVANASTVGFRGEGTKFDTIVSDKASDDVSFATAGKSYIRTEAGPLIKTDNPLDVAVKGDAWMSFSTPQGQVYSRDGRMKMLSTGDLVSVTGNAILDVGGAPIVLNPGGGAPRISSDGAIYQNGVQVGAIGLYTIPADADLAYAGTSGVIPSKPAQPVVDDNSVGVVQGMIESSNVDAMTEMTRLISISRAFEQVNNLLSQQEATVSEAIKTLGSKNG
ncbi:flagellar basal-body rod protein FlgF [Brucella neotomae]|uniref:Flagellar basal-body rod protein FlgF n=1 Tax=Brucella neotomae 5K33 TaxID=520456 RepID=A0A7U8K7N8_BRUNE|nr:flagellar basal-body rod protein FlgF [Brucella neotomae]EEY03076.1 flagellar basal body rod protein FlgF [Brucella neotomae 5K33]KEX99331.1 flagellar basal body rod protein FlgF [Brucella neotomae 5K33]KFJ57741.1 flagellar basal-body rod protein FlgF [Brucella neotomae 5K33]SPU69971.1 flagellar basal body rod protein FlgF [Brucella neotomae]SPU71199.1 flagellar basal body rod protein FlgF [Brucella neotomae]